MSQKWKDKLLSSSFPLEFEAMKELSKDGFSVSSEFAYSRLDGDTRKDFSVDIDALCFTPFENEDDVTGSVHLLIECKYRKKGTKWLFLPDPNRSDYSPFTLGQTIRAIDNFSYDVLPPNCVVPFDEKEGLEFCFKGVEVDTANASAHDGQIRHGLSQLQYALPPLLTHSIMFGSNIPFFICPILLTNAPLYVANKDFSMVLVQESNEIENMAKEVPYLVTYQDVSPDFTQHCVSEFNANFKYSFEELESIGAFRLSEGEYEHQLPIPLVKSLTTGELSTLKGYFTQFIVCNWDHFPTLISDIKANISMAMETVKTDT
ncbi:TPA: hypothetical protein NJ492_004466 [Vibrio parahaemolyticus]|nr:hypothetical protein [Vibrio parahaemolyticus]